MAGGWRIGPSWGAPQDIQTNGAGLSQCVGSATAYVVGGWQQAVASTTYDAAVLMIQFQSGGDQSGAMDIAVGASGSETVIVQGLLVNHYSGALGAYYTLPVSIPAGSRIAVRCSTSGGNFDSVYYRMTLFSDGALSGYGCGSRIDTYGFNAAANIGATLTPGATTPNKGAYVQLTASATYDLAGFSLTFDGQNYTGGAYGDISVDIAIGAAGLETVIVPNFWNFWSPNNSPLLCQSPHFAIPIRAGTRIAARAATNGDPTYPIGVTLYGVRL